MDWKTGKYKSDYTLDYMDNAHKGILRTISYFLKILMHIGQGFFIVKLQVLGLRLGVDFTFTLDNNHNDNNHNHNDNNNNPHLNFFKGTVLGVKEQGLGIRDKG